MIPSFQLAKEYDGFRQPEVDTHSLKRKRLLWQDNASNSAPSHANHVPNFSNAPVAFSGIARSAGVHHVRRDVRTTQRLRDDVINLGIATRRHIIAAVSAATTLHRPKPVLEVGRVYGLSLIGDFADTTGIAETRNGLRAYDFASIFVRRSLGS